MPDTAAPIGGVRLCVRCGSPGPFARSHVYQKVCDRCKADPSSKARHSSDVKIRWARARSEAVRRLIANHPDEYDMLLAQERASQGEAWVGATLREIDDYERRREEAAAAGWMQATRAS